MSNLRWIRQYRANVHWDSRIRYLLGGSQTELIWFTSAGWNVNCNRLVLLGYIVNMAHASLYSSKYFEEFQIIYLFIWRQQNFMGKKKKKKSCPMLKHLSTFNLQQSVLTLRPNLRSVVCKWLLVSCEIRFYEQAK